MDRREFTKALAVAALASMADPKMIVGRASHAQWAKGKAQITSEEGSANMTESRPNVLLLFSDQQRYEGVGC